MPIVVTIERDQLVALLKAAHSSLRTFRNVPKEDQEWLSSDEETTDAIDKLLTDLGE